MLVVEGIKLMVGLFAVSLIVFAAMPDMGFLNLAKMLAASFGASILFVLLYPRVRGVKKGDKVQVVGFVPGPFEGHPVMNLFGASGVSLVDCRPGGDITVRISDGREAVGVLEANEGLFSLPRARIVYEQGAEVVR